MRALGPASGGGTVSRAGEAPAPIPPPSADAAAARFVPPDAKPAFEKSRSTYTLDNGLKVVLSRDTTAPT